MSCEKKRDDFFKQAGKDRRAEWDKVWADGKKNGESIEETRKKARKVWKEFFEKNRYVWA